MILVDPELIAPKEAAIRLGLSEPCLANWRSQQRGPRYVKIGRSVYYRPADLSVWVAAQVVDPATRKAAS